MKYFIFLFVFVLTVHPVSSVMGQEIGERTVRDVRVKEQKIPQKFVIQPPLPKLSDANDQKGPIAQGAENKMIKDMGAKPPAASAKVTTGKLSADKSDKDGDMHDHGDGKMHSHGSGKSSHNHSNNE